LSVGDSLYAISEAGLTLTASTTEDTLKVYPAEIHERRKAMREEVGRIAREEAEKRGQRPTYSLPNRAGRRKNWK
jgi:hypothetical protein